MVLSCVYHVQRCSPGLKLSYTWFYHPLLPLHVHVYTTMNLMHCQFQLSVVHSAAVGPTLCTIQLRWPVSWRHTLKEWTFPSFSFISLFSYLYSYLHGFFEPFNLCNSSVPHLVNLTRKHLLLECLFQTVYTNNTQHQVRSIIGCSGVCSVLTPFSRDVTSFGCSHIRFYKMFV